MSCLNSLVKYAVVASNFVVFLLSVAVFGLGIWILVDSPSFLDLFQKAQDLLESNEFDLPIYTSAVYVLLVVSAIVALVTFLGCCGAIKESRCMLMTYFITILALFIVCIVGAVIGLQGDLETSIEKPLLETLGKYQDNPSKDTPEFAYKAAWNQAQQDFLCCGVKNASDWKSLSAAGWVDGYNKPEGCCMFKRSGEESTETTEAEKQECRKADMSKATVYYFEGCWTKFLEEIESSQDILIGVAIGVIVFMFVNMLFSFALWTMA